MDIKLLFAFLNFAVLLFLLRRYVRQPVRDFLTQRSQTLQKELQEMLQLRRQTEARFMEFRKRLQSVDKEIGTLRKEMEKEGRLEKEHLIRQAKQYAEKIQKDTGLISQQELRKAKFHLRQQVVSQALQIAQRVVRERLTTEDHERLMDDFIGQLRQNPASLEQRS